MHHLCPQSDEEAKQLQGLKALQGLGKSSDKVYGPLQRTFQVTPGATGRNGNRIASVCCWVAETALIV